MHMRRGARIHVIIAAVAAILLILLTACQNNNNEGQNKPNQPVNKSAKQELAKVNTQAAVTANWPGNGGTTYNQRYSALNQINTSNVAQLKEAWEAHLGSGTEFKYSGEATPLVIDGVMYVISAADDVLALDAKTGKTIWEYRPKVTQELTTVCCGWTSRGVAVGEGKVFVGLLDARLVALDQKTGKVVWETRVAEWEKGYTITSAPLYYKGKVYTGLAGGEYGIRGRVTAFDAEMGRELWRFYTIPGPGEKGHDTWPKDNKLWMRGGGPVWQTPAVDPETDIMYFSTGNPSPDLDGSERKGDNLFTNSILAIDANTGEYKWHFQEVHHDIWDMDAPCPVVLFDVNMDGKLRKAIGQAGKTGWVYLLDRTNGKPLIGIEEKKVPQEPRQHTAATQPYPKGDAFAPNTINEEDLKRDIPKFKGKYGDIFTPFWDEPILVKPSPLGGANWPPMSYNQDTEMLYVLGNDKYFTATRSEEEFKEGTEIWGSVIAPVNESPTKGTVTAIDVKTNKIAWQVNWDTTAYSGTLSTKGGLVFVGHNDGRLIAFDAKTGKQLWEFQTGAGVNAPPISYEVDGVQYVSVYAAGNSLAGTKHGDSVWSFSLEGKAKGGAVSEQPKTPAPAEEPKTAPNETVEAEGETLYKQNCLACHGPEGANGHNGPNLQVSNVAEDYDAVVKKIIEGGSTMPSFDGVLTEAQIQAVADYISKVVAPKAKNE